MKIVKFALFICFFVMPQSYTLGDQTKLNIILEGNGSVKEERGIERIHVEGTVKDDITGAFLWEEEHQPAFELGRSIERGTITITDQNGDRLVLKFSGKTKKMESGESDLEGAAGGFTYLEGSGYWAERHVEGTYSKAGVFQGDSIELTASLTAEVK